MKISRVTGTALHHQCPNQTSPQPCHVEIDVRRGGLLSAAYDPEVGGGYPAAISLGFIHRWKVPALRAEAANSLLEEVRPLAERVLAGYGTRWNGNGEVASFSPDAQAALEAIEHLCDGAGGEGAVLVVWSAAEWYAPTGDEESVREELDVTAATTDEELAALAQRELEVARPDVDDIEGLLPFLTNLRDTARASAAAA